MGKKLFVAKVQAFFIHFSITLVVALLAAYLIFGVWFSGSFSQMLGGTELYFILLGVELLLGPSMSLVIFNPKKGYGELVRDYLIVCLFQFGALAYGLLVISGARPVYLVFVKDRVEVVTAVELEKEDLDIGGRVLPWFGAEHLCSEGPVSPEEKAALLMSALNGKDIQFFPKYYRACAEDEMMESAYSKDQWVSLTPHDFSTLPGDLKEQEFSWLPIVNRFGVWTAFYLESHEESNPLYLDIDPFY